MMALSSERDLHLMLYHRLILEVRWHCLSMDYSLYSVPWTLVGDAPNQPSWHRYWTLPWVPHGVGGVSPDQDPLWGKQSLLRISKTFWGVNSCHRSLWRNETLCRVLCTKDSVSPSRESSEVKVLFPNAPNKENDIDPSIFMEDEGPWLPPLNKLQLVLGLIVCWKMAPSEGDGWGMWPPP